MSEIGGSTPGPNPAGELAKTVLDPLLCVSGLLMALVGIIDEDISLEFVGAIMGLVGYLLGWRARHRDHGDLDGAADHVQEYAQRPLPPPRAGARCRRSDRSGREHIWRGIARTDPAGMRKIGRASCRERV